MFYKILFIGIAGVVFFSFAGLVSADDLKGVPIDQVLYPKGAPTTTGKTPDSNPNAYVESVIETRIYLTMRFVNAVLGIAGVVAIFFILNNAWYMIASAGSEEKITQHKKGLMWALVGLVLIILSYSIIRFIVSIPFQAGEVPTPSPVTGEISPGDGGVGDWEGLSQAELQRIAERDAAARAAPASAPEDYPTEPEGEGGYE